MLAVLRKEIELREDLNLTPREPLDSKPSNERRNIRAPHTASSLLTQENKIFNRKCAFCLEDHKHEDCETVKDIRSRKSIARKYARCFICLFKGHVASACRLSNKK